MVSISFRGDQTIAELTAGTTAIHEILGFLYVGKIVEIHEKEWKVTSLKREKQSTGLTTFTLEEVV